MALNHKQIGEVADRTDLSLRSIRYYEEVGLVIPSARSRGGFRLYTESDIARLMLIKRMKPLGFSLEETRDLLSVVDALDAAQAPGADAPDARERDELLDRLTMYQTAADERCAALRDQLEMAEEFAANLRREARRQRRAANRDTNRDADREARNT
ncbi:MerR family transcriptional regulator [Myceligenerans pegani]|uniref:MerR family transcriptional regulator n=1 Tax=Myceligenerans pegani TaxID=2776917 RepID=A0ABR9N172_9MICO|nr:MerR family transcriptional regulator [Myceligenerans sp. TRM 65318]MBE1877407.1 MerR family transcriptional regulator [Myceligenerans sp. TRM 65318]MBE3019678.1 MerR family transcriptional regulator [Myceligenerans sp. TRM 65318]